MIITVIYCYYCCYC